MMVLLLALLVLPLMAVELSYDDGTYTRGFWSYGGLEYVAVEFEQETSGELDGVRVMFGHPGNTPENVAIYVFDVFQGHPDTRDGVDPIAGPIPWDVGDVFYTWLELDFEEPIEVPDHFFIGLSAEFIVEDIHDGVGIDSGSGEEPDWQKSWYKGLGVPWVHPLDDGAGHPFNRSLMIRCFWEDSQVVDTSWGEIKASF